MRCPLQCNKEVTKLSPLARRWTAIEISVEKAVGLPFYKLNDVKFDGQHSKLREQLIKLYRGSQLS
jgi:hypothetical protein